MPTMPERMATQEALMGELRDDVKTVKADVRTLLAAYNRTKGQNALFRAVPWAALIAAGAALFLK